MHILHSPWSKAQQEPDNPFEDISLPDMYGNNEISVPQPASMRNRINFDDDEDELHYDVDEDPRMNDMK